MSFRVVVKLLRCFGISVFLWLALPTWSWQTVLQPSILTVYQVAPERLSLNTLYDNIRILDIGAQKTSRFEIAFW